MGEPGDDQIGGLVIRWAEDRAELLYSGSHDRRELHAELQRRDDAFVRALTALIPPEGGSQVLNQAWRTAKQKYNEAIERICDLQAISGASARSDIQREINDVWQAVGMWRGRTDDQSPIKDLLRKYEVRRQIHIEALTEQFRDISHERPEEVRRRVERTLELVCEQAAERGERRYLKAVGNARDLYEGLPGRAAQPDQIFRKLWMISASERVDACDVFDRDYGEPLLVGVGRAYRSPLGKIKSFLRIPALKAALEDEEGIGAGLWKGKEGRRVFTRSWKGRLAKFRQSASILASAVRQLIPRGARDWSAYRRQFVKFQERLGEKATRPELARIEALLLERPVEAAVHTLFLSMWRGDARVDQQAIDVLGQLSPAELQQVERQFALRYRRAFGARPLRKIAADYLTADEVRYLDALLDGDRCRAMAFKFHRLLQGTESQKIELMQWLTQLPNNVLSEVLECYEKEWTTTVDRAFLDRYMEGPLLDWADYLIRNESQLAAAARLESALRRQSTEWPGMVFYDQPEERDLAVIDAHERLYRTSFWEHFRSMGGLERVQIMQTLVTEGSLSLAEQIRHCMIGIGADTEAIKACFADLTPKQNARLGQQYAMRFSRMRLAPSNVWQAARMTLSEALSRRTLRNSGRHFLRRLRGPRDLDEDLSANLCGYNWFDVCALRAGKTTNPTTLYARLMQRFKFEHAGACYEPPGARDRRWSARLLSCLADGQFGPAAKAARMLQRKHPAKRLKDRDVDAAVAFYESYVRDSQPNEQQRRQFEMTVRVAHERLDAFRELQNRRAERQANLGALATSTLAFLGLVMMNLPYLPLAITVGASSLAGRYLIKTRIKGDGYGEREVARDAFMALVDGPTLALGQFVKTLRLLQALGLGRTVLGSAVKMTVTQTVRRWGQARITAALLESKKSIHARRHLETRQDEILAEYGRILQQERERMLAGRRKTVMKLASIERVFQEVGKQVAARNDESEPTTA